MYEASSYGCVRPSDLKSRDERSYSERGAAEKIVRFAQVPVIDFEADLLRAPPRNVSVKLGVEVR